MTTPESNEMAALPSAEPAVPSAAQTTPTPTPSEPATSSILPPSSSSIPAATTNAPTTGTPKTARGEEDITTVATHSLASEAGPSSSNAVQRKESEAIGPAAEDGSHPRSPTAEADAGPTVLITLLLTTGKRHPYKIDAKYLRKRNVSVEDNNPWNLPVQTLKELILRDWREDWEERPNSPSAIRLISMGLELHEGELLKEKRFNQTGPNIVHMVIKRELPEDEEIKKDSRKGGSETGSRNRSGCCGCVIL